MLKSSLCYYIDAYILVEGRITITGAGPDAAARQADEINKGVIVKNCALFINCKSEINTTKIDNAKDINIIMPMYDLIEYSGNYTTPSGNLWQYYKDEPNYNLTNSESLKSKIKIIGNAPVDGNTKYVKIIVPLKYLSNFWRTLEMPLNNFKVNLILTSNCLVDLSFQGVNRLFVLYFEKKNGRTSHSEYYLPKVEIKDYNVKIDGKNIFDKPINWSRR